MTGHDRLAAVLAMVGSIDPLTVTCPVCEAPPRQPCPQPESRQRTIESHTVRSIVAAYPQKGSP